MKRGKAILFVIIIILLYLVIYVLNKSQTKQFDWKPTYHTQDKNPFGGYVFDEMLEASWDREYIHTYKNIHRMILEEELVSQNLLIIGNRFVTSKEEANALLDYIAEGHNVLIAATAFDEYDYRLQDTLRFRIAIEDWYNSFAVQRNKDTLQIQRKLYLASPTFQGKEYRFPKQICYNYFDSIPERCQVIATNDSNQAIAIQYNMGEGKLILCSLPMLFTNYGILSDDNEFVWGLLSYLQGADLMRTEYYEIGNEIEDTSELRYIMSQPPLRWACYIAIVTIILFMVFTARRKQKVIPVVKDPENQLLNFVRSMAALYLRKSNNADILKKKYLLFAEQLSKDYHIDIINQPRNSTLFEHIAQKTGTDLKEIKVLFQGLELIDSDFVVGDQQLMDLVILMDKVVKTL